MKLLTGLSSVRQSLSFTHQPVKQQQQSHLALSAQASHCTTPYTPPPDCTYQILLYFAPALGITTHYGVDRTGLTLVLLKVQVHHSERRHTGPNHQRHHQLRAAAVACLFSLHPTLHYIYYCYHYFIPSTYCHIIFRTTYYLVCHHLAFCGLPLPGKHPSASALHLTLLSCCHEYAPSTYRHIRLSIHDRRPIGISTYYTF